MGRRERLEAIRRQNESSYNDPAFRRAQRLLADARPVGNPWLSIWLRPTATIRTIVAGDPDPGRWVLTITLLSGFGRAVTRAETKGLGDLMPFSGVLAVCVLAGPLLAILSLYLGAYLLRVTGGWLGGRAETAEVRAALAWAAVPQVVVALLWIPAVLVLREDLFTRAKLEILRDPLKLQLLRAIHVEDLILLGWSSVLAIVCLAEVFRISRRRVLASIVLMAPVFCVVMFVLVFPVLMLSDRVLIRRNPARGVLAVARPLPARPPQPSPPRRLAQRPAVELGPAVAAIWEEGYQVEAVVDRDHPDHPVIKLSITPDIDPGDGDAVLRHLRGLPHLRSLSLWIGRTVTDAGLRHLRGVRGLQALFICCARITDAGLENLSGLTELQDLHLLDCDQVTGRGLVYVKGARGLRKLNLFDCGITFQGLAAIRNLTALEELDLGGMHLDDASLVHLEGLGIETLRLGGYNPIRGPGLVHLKSLPRLRVLDLVNDPVTDAAVEHLEALTGLRRLDLDGTEITPAGLERLRAALPETKIDPPPAEEPRPNRAKGRPAVAGPQGGS